jgi:hypothetical protein
LLFARGYRGITFYIKKEGTGWNTPFLSYNYYFFHGHHEPPASSDNNQTIAINMIRTKTNALIGAGNIGTRK